MDGIDVALIETDGEDRGRARALRRPAPIRSTSASRSCAQASRRRAALDRPARAARAPRQSSSRSSPTSTPMRCARFLEDHRLDARTSTSSASTARRCCTYVAARLARPAAIEPVAAISAAMTRPRHPDGAARRRRAASPADRHRRRLRPARGRLRRPADRARRWRRSITARWPPSCRSGPSSCSTSAAWPTSPGSGATATLLAFDTGPGNAMIDDWMQRRRGVPRDEDGALAAAGRVHDDYVTQYLRHSYFGEPPPKSLDRNAFSAGARRRPLAGGRRRDADGLHRHQHRPRARALPRAAASCGSSPAAAGATRR